MKSLGIAFAIVAVAGTIIYVLLAVVLKVEGFAGAFSGLLFATLPFIHQELEKRESTRGSSSNVMAPSMPMSGPPMSPPAGPPQYQPSTLTPPAPSNLIPPNPSMAPPQVVQKPITQAQYANPVPVYVPSMPIQQTGNNAPVMAINPTAAAINASSPRTRSTTVLLAYGAAITIAIFSASILITDQLWSTLFELFYKADSVSDFGQFTLDFSESILPYLILAVGVFFVAWWTARRAAANGFLIAVGAVVLGLTLSRLINLAVGYNDTWHFVTDYFLSSRDMMDLRFNDPVAYASKSEPLTWLVFFGALIFESVIAAVGYSLSKALRKNRPVS